jgi:hypothetical protein
MNMIRLNTQQTDRKLNLLTESAKPELTHAEFDQALKDLETMDARD